MGSINKFRKKFRKSNDPDAPSGYHFQKEDRDRSYTSIYQTLYDEADRLEWQRMFGLSSSSPEGQLIALQNEIKIRVKITKNEIFKIGELLISAKKICQQEGKKFQEWINNNLDFSYETANNFMNVYELCLGQRGIAMYVKPSILYKISAPSFPDELRNYLFDTEQLDEITGGQLREITRRYKEGGFEAIRDDIEELNRGRLVINQSCHALDMVENTLRTLEAVKDKIQRHTTGRDILTFEDQIKRYETEASAVNSKLFAALQSAIDILDAARKESTKILSDVHDGILKRCGVVEPDGGPQKRLSAELDAELKKQQTP